MIKIKFYINKKKIKSEKTYSLYLRKKNIKTNYSKAMKLGNYISKIKLYMFLYSKLIAYFKLGTHFSKRFSLRSFFYLKNLLDKNISLSRRNGRVD